MVPFHCCSLFAILFFPLLLSFLVNVAVLIVIGRCFLPRPLNCGSFVIIWHRLMGLKRRMFDSAIVINFMPRVNVGYLPLIYSGVYGPSRNHAIRRSISIISLMPINDGRDFSEWRHNVRDGWTKPKKKLTIWMKSKSTLYNRVMLLTYRRLAWRRINFIHSIPIPTQESHFL